MECDGEFCYFFTAFSYFKLNATDISNTKATFKSNGINMPSITSLTQGRST